MACDFGLLGFPRRVLDSGDQGCEYRAQSRDPANTRPATRRKGWAAPRIGARSCILPENTCSRGPAWRTPNTLVPRFRARICSKKSQGQHGRTLKILWTPPTKMINKSGPQPCSVQAKLRPHEPWSNLLLQSLAALQRRSLYDP